MPPKPAPNYINAYHLPYCSTFARAIVAVVFIILTFISGAFASVKVEPFGFAVGIEPDDQTAVGMTLTNDGNQTIGYSVRGRLIREGLFAGPRRDNPGDVIRQFRPPGGDVQHYNVGLAFDEDNRWMWNNDFHTGRCWALDVDDEDFAAVRQFDVEARCMSTALLNNHLYMIVDPQQYLTHYNTQGQRLENVRFNFTTYAVTMSKELGYLFIMGSDGGVHVWTVNNDGMAGEEVGVIRNWAQFVANSPCRSMLWVDLHSEGQLWFHSTRGPNNEAGNWAWQVSVDTERWEVRERLQVFRTRDGAGAQHWDGVGHDGENLWFSYWQETNISIIDDGISEVRLLAIEPREGEIAPDESAELEIGINSNRTEAGTYNHNLEITITQGEEVHLITVSAVVTVGEGIVTVSGTVADAANGNPIEGAKIALSPYIMERDSDSDGFYTFESLPLGNYTLTYTAPDYLLHTEDINPQDEGEFDLDVELLHATCNPNVDDLFATLSPNEEIDLQFVIANTGNGTLTYRTQRNLLGDANAEPWTIRRSYNSGQDLGDDRLEGAVFDGERFYVCGAAGNEPNTIYILNREGELIDQFVQPGESVYGMKDLEWDGELIWGSGERRVFGFSTEGEVAVEFQGPYNPNSVIAFDSRNDLIWVAATTNDIVAYDREGNRVNRTLNRKGLRLYGLAYWPDDPDGYPLYIFHSPAANDVRIHKMNPENNGDTLFVANLYTNGGVAPGGAFITNQYDVYSWVMIAIANIPRNNGNDRIDILQIDARKDWFRLDPAEGNIVAGEEQEFNLHLNSAGLPPVTFEGEIVFYHDGVGSMTRIPVTLEVVEGVVRTFRDLQLAQGWNLVSVNLQPDEEDVTVITRPLVNEGLLQLMKNGFGQFYAPAVGFNNIPGWFAPQGYWLKLTEAAVLRVSGLSVLADEPIELARGWNLVSYYPRRPVAVDVALAGIVDHLLIAKDGFGSFYVPAWGFNNMAPLQEGRGYQFKVDEDIELVYRTGQIQSVPRLNNKTVTEFNSAVNTGQNMSLLLLTDKSSEGFIQVFANDRQVGLGYAQDGLCGIAVWGDDPTTEEIDGAVEGGKIAIKWANKSVYHSEELVYKTDGFEVIKMDNISEISPVNFDLVSLYPNPFNSQALVRFGLTGMSNVDCALYDLAGRRVMTLQNGRMTAGYHSLKVDGTALPSGVYIVRLNAGGKVTQMKVALVK